MEELQKQSVTEGREIIQIVGQHVGVRKINFSDPADVARIERINDAPMVKKYLGNMIKSDLLFALAQTGFATVYGVAGVELLSPDGQ